MSGPNIPSLLFVVLEEESPRLDNLAEELAKDGQCNFFQEWDEFQKCGKKTDAGLETDLGKIAVVFVGHCVEVLRGRLGLLLGSDDGGLHHMGYYLHKPMGFTADDVVGAHDSEPDRRVTDDFAADGGSVRETQAVFGHRLHDVSLYGNGSWLLDEMSFVNGAGVGADGVAIFFAGVLVMQTLNRTLIARFLHGLVKNLAARHMRLGRLGRCGIVGGGRRCDRSVARVTVEKDGR